MLSDTLSIIEMVEESCLSGLLAKNKDCQKFENHVHQFLAYFSKVNKEINSKRHKWRYFVTGDFVLLAKFRLYFPGCLLESKPGESMF